jgi:hypothetical protein
MPEGSGITAIDGNIYMDKQVDTKIIHIHQEDSKNLF